MARLAAMDPLLLAQECLDELDLDQSRPVDVVQALSRLDLTTAVVDLGDVLGVVVPQGGVLLSSQRGQTVQRYTAAHEIGHWVMHREHLVIDLADDVIGDPTSLRERQAQLFASYFLMPPPLLFDALNRVELVPDRVEPAQVYVLARDLRVSYEAALVRLKGEGFLTAAQLKELKRVGRGRARAAAFDGRRPRDGRADMWDVRYGADQELDVTAGDEILVQLPENRTTPYRWTHPYTPLRAVVGRDRPRAPSDRRPQAQADPAGSDSADQPPAWEAAPSAAARRAALRLLPDRDDGVDRQQVSIERTADGAPEQGLVIASDEFVIGTSHGTVQRRARLGQAPPAAAVPGGSPDPVQAGGLGERLLQVRCPREGSFELPLVYRHAYDGRLDPAAAWSIQVTVDPPLALAQRRLLMNIDLDDRQPGDPADEAIFG
jgi:Zn-dependent peptidase ImmA (M78 family)/predicted secreted protein